MPFSWSNYSNENPAVVLSPMSGYTDSPFKQLIRHCCPQTVVVTEFLSTDAIYYKSEKTLRMMAFDEAEHPVILQVFGKKPDRFIHAAKVAEEMGYDGIDINMGCPAKKIINSDHGSALVKIENRDTAMRIVSGMAEAVNIPVTVKTRLGWEDASELIGFCQELEQNGCAAVCIHGRTTKQGYRGEANWDPIYELKRNMKIPVFGNGDISSVSAFRNKLGNLDGVFVARASFGDPWIFADIHDYINSREELKDLSDEELDAKYPRTELLTWQQKKPIAIKHCELAVKVKGEWLGMMEMRKHLAAYIKGLPGAREAREKLVRVEKLDEAISLLNTLKL